MRRNAKRIVGETKKEAKKNLTLVKSAQEAIAKMRVSQEKERVELAAMTEKRKALEAQLTELDGKITHLEAISSNYESEIAARQKELSKQEALIEKAEERLSKVKAEIDEKKRSLKVELEAVRAESVNLLIAEQNNAKAEIERLDKAILMRQEKMALIDEKITAKKRELSLLKKDENALLDRVQQYNSLLLKESALREELVKLELTTSTKRESTEEAIDKSAKAEGELRSLLDEIEKNKVLIKTQKVQLLSLSTRESALARREKHLADKCEKFGLRVTDL